MKVLRQLRLLEVEVRPPEDLGLDLAPALELGGGQTGRIIDEDPGRSLALHLLIFNEPNGDWRRESILSK